MRLVGATYPLFWEPDSELGWKHIPGAGKHFTEEGNAYVTINRLGQRDEERDLRKPPGTYRIAIFGDSLTEAVQVELKDTFCQILEDRFSSPESPVEVLNFGVSGYSPVQELLAFMSKRPLYQPDLVILGLFTDNDVAGCHPNLNPTSGAAPYAFIDGDAVRFDFSRTRESYDDYHRLPVFFIRKHSCIYRFLSERRLRREAQPSGLSGSIPKRYLLYEEPLRMEWEEAWTIFERILREVVGEAKQHGVPLVWLSVPAGQVVYDESWAAILDDEPAMTEKTWNLEGPEERLAGLASAHQVPLIQPYRTFRDVDGDTPLYFGRAGHLTVAGHALMAEVIGHYLLENGYVAELPSPDRTR